MLEAYLGGPLPPLLIFTGPEGTGKYSAAEAFIQQKLCLNGSGCGECISCRKFLHGNHPDFIRFPDTEILIGDAQKPEENTIRWLIRTRVIYTPFDGGLRFVLFPSAEKIHHEAETALLKTLEEPPEHTRFILLAADAADIKQTVISRGVTIPFQLLPSRILREFLENFTEEMIDMMGGSLNLFPFFESALFTAMKEKTGEALKHPFSLAALERWLVTGEKKAFSDLLGDIQLSYPQILDIFSLVFLKMCEQHPQRAAVASAIFEFKGELNRRFAGMSPYLTGRLFHELNAALFPG